ncbi:MAG: phosphoribosylformylglycinamidine synthase subunit PurL [Actinomycetota bacterium]|nr:phosphoribosylformylglycinamidine synthase subunit PurL [Actinomycetota bacterium]
MSVPPVVRVEIRGGGSAHAAAVLSRARDLGLSGVERCEVVRVVHLAGPPTAADVELLCDRVLVDPVLERASWAPWSAASHHEPADGARVVEVGLRPGVTDAEARTLEAVARRLGTAQLRASTVTRYELAGDIDDRTLDDLVRRLLVNETVERWAPDALEPAFVDDTDHGDAVEVVAVRGSDDDTLAKIGAERRLALDAAELAAIRDHFTSIDRDPTDAELETLAQTWSEHCVHKTFRARITAVELDANGNEVGRSEIDGLLRQLRDATDELSPPWLRSAFVDNAGIIDFDDDLELSVKVETHNHPSALEPFGGANTGVGGVVRDVIGVSTRPVAVTDVLCFGPPDTAPTDVPDGVLHPRRVAEGVIAGVGDYGNKLGLPTASGAVVYHEGYTANPLVYCGCVGLAPKGSHPTDPRPGDLIVLAGGRTGRDGIRGATFSSAELEHDTAEVAGSAVQIGDPITEKQLIELVEAARDERLYHAITDCGAGGLSSAVGEMGEKVGAEVDLVTVPRKYPGLEPWEVWLSEAQERMVFAVAPDDMARLTELARRFEVEVCAIGTFTGDGRLTVRHGERTVVDLPMDFLHDGIPRRALLARWSRPAPATGDRPAAATATSADLGDLVLRVLADPTVASKEDVFRTYDHEVRGGTLVRPTCGPEADAPTDAAVLKPLGTWDHERSFAISCGVNPRHGLVDPYEMALGAVDEAFRNLVAVGADPDRVALLDNFCWGDPSKPDRLGGLARAVQGCVDASLTYRAPFVSGKDSLNNEFMGSPIPGTLLVTAVGFVERFAHVTTPAGGRIGDAVVVVGETRAELGGSIAAEHDPSLAAAAPGAPTSPAEPLVRYRAVHRAITDGLVRAAHDPSEGGLAVALAELALSHRTGLDIGLGTDGPLVDPAAGPLDAAAGLFSETHGRLVLVVDPDDVAALARVLDGVAHEVVGHLVEAPRLRIAHDGATVVDLGVDELAAAWNRDTNRDAHGTVDA